MAKSLRLLFVSNLYPPYEIGGFEQLCHEISTALSSRGHFVQVLTSQYGQVSGDGQEKGVTRSLNLLADINWYRPLDFFTRRAQQDKHNAAQLLQAIERFSPDLIVFWGMWNLSPNLPDLAEKVMPGRVIYYIASFWPLDQDIHLEYWQAPARRAITEKIKRPIRAYALTKLAREGYPPRLKFEHVKCVSRYLRDEMVGSNKLPSNAGVLYVGIDPRPFLDRPASPSFDKDPLRLLYFGTLIHQKGVHTIIEALGILKQKGLSKALELSLLGGGRPDYLAQLKDLVIANGLSGSIQFIDKVARDQIPIWLSKFDIFIFSSMYAEAMARTVMEAMASGLLVISSRVGGQIELLDDGHNALTFEPGNAGDLASKLIEVIEAPSKFQHLTKNAREMILDKFTLQRMTDNFEIWLREIYESHPR